MTPSAIFMMLFALLFTWGGAIICLAIALKKKKN